MKRNYSLIAATTLLSLSAISQAEEYQVGNWWIGPIDNGLVASVSIGTPTGSGFGMVCEPQTVTCAWRLTRSHSSCLQGQWSPVLVSTQQGAATMQFYCDGLSQDRASYVSTVSLEDHTTMTRVIRSSSYISFSLPTVGGTFDTIYFNTAGGTGMLDALAEMLNTKKYPAAKANQLTF